MPEALSSMKTKPLRRFSSLLIDYDIQKKKLAISEV